LGKISQLPEAIFAQVNENFYRTTFYELCSRYLVGFCGMLNVLTRRVKAIWNLWANIMRSLRRWVIEFKYYSNAALKKSKTRIENWKLLEEDTLQIKGYAEGLKEEYPEARISQFVIYCFGNQGFRVFAVDEAGV